METHTEIHDYYKINGYTYYLSEIQDKEELKFSSNTVLRANHD